MYFLSSGGSTETVSSASSLTVEQITIQPPLLQGHTSPYSQDVTEWKLSESQSNIGGRSGSNACVFIALYTGKLIMQRNLEWPQNNHIPNALVDAFKDAMTNGNKIHDDLFDLSPVNLEVDDAVVMAGEECGVQTVLYQTDVFGANPQTQLADLFDIEAQHMLKSCSVVVADGRALLFIVNQDKSAMLLDSHNHGNHGAVIAHTSPGDVVSLAVWLKAMMQTDWQCTLNIASVHKIMYR